jgi:hypothetical protein
MPHPKEENIYINCENFNIRWSFRNFIGNIRGKHIRIQCPPNYSSQHFNYKQYHSIVLQAAVDANLKFVTVGVGAYGKQRDGGLFQYQLCIRAWKLEV